MHRFVTGLAERCYNGVSVIRGYAPADILIKSSVAHSAYQRGKDEAHVNEIFDFVQRGVFAFMPEIILSYDYKNIYDGTSQDLFAQLDSGQEFRDEEFDLRIKKLASRYSRHIRLTFPEKIVKIPFRRLDGNHRLEALYRLPEAQQVKTQIPYAIILFCSQVGEPQMLKNEMTIFHNLNTKGLKLSSEQQIRGLLKLFSAEELEDFGDELSGIKRYIIRYKGAEFRHLKNFLTDTYPALKAFWSSPRSMLQMSLQMAKRKKSIDPAKLNKVLRYIDSNVFTAHPALQKTRCMDLLPIYVHYATASTETRQTEAKIMAFTNWVLSNKLYIHKNMDAACTIEIFDRLYEIRKKQIFVAMPFKDSLNFVFESIKKSVSEINKKFHLEIPEPIRIDKRITGFSYDIVQSILDNIKGAGLLIADLTDQNANVYYEAGYAQGLIHAKLGNTTQILYLISNPEKPDEPFEKGKFDLQHYKMIPYKNTGNGPAELEKRLIEELKAFYKIRD